MPILRTRRFHQLASTLALAGLVLAACGGGGGAANGYGINSQLGQDAEGNTVIVYVAPDRWPNPTTGSDVYSRRLSWGGAWSSAACG